MRTDIYAGWDEEEASKLYYADWFAAGSWHDTIPDAVLSMGSYAFSWGWQGNMHLFDHTFWAEGHEFFGFIQAAHTAGIRCKDEWTEGN